jgi:hypothetical protein
MPRRPVLVVLASFVVLAVVAALVIAGTGGPGPSEDPGRAAADTGVPRAEPPGESGGDSEIAEEAELAAEREEALEAARDAGTFGTAEAIASDPAPGWYGERLMNPKTDDWEPAVAADPKEPFLYLLTTRFGAGKTCASHCPSPYIAMARSTDNGATWKDQVPLCVCRGSGAQYDPTIEVVPNTGDVYSVFLNADRAGGFSTVFIRSRDHGRTWTDPVHVYRNSWTDKPEVTMSASGKDVYVSWNGQTGGDPWIGQSHDYGKTWTQTRIVTSKRYFFAYDADVLPDGTVVFAESSLLYTGGGVENQVWHHVILSRDGGDTWQNKIVDKVGVGESCVAEGCYPDFYLGQPSIASDARGHLVYAYEGATRAYAPQRVYVSRSSDEGRTWSERIALSTDGENATQPRVAAIGNGDARLWYMQTSNGDDPDAWNVWYRSSSDGGRTWSAPVKLSDATSGAGYKAADGFEEIYGDYGEIAITSAGKTFAAWGEAFSYLGPGGTWFNLQR